ncbi:MAG: ABC transporter substrate-binding protein [Dehalococcoidia bacterium]|nr:ABC transporter substrate-binding protein [Dehalococcoidia bacterium]
MTILPRLFAAVILITQLVSFSPGCIDEPAKVFVTPSPTALPVSVSRTVIDDLDRRVEFRGTPHRIVALSPATVEILFSVGVSPIGRPSGAEYPEAAKQVTVIGAMHRPNYERITELKPDLVVGNAVPNDPRIPQLEKLDTPSVFFSTNSYADFLKTTKAVGQIVDRETEARRAITTLEDRMAAIKVKIPTEKPTVLVLLGGGNIIYCALPASYVGGLVRELGATNIAYGPEDKRYRGFTQCSLERLLERDPEVIIAIRPSVSPERAPSVLRALEADQRWRDWKSIRARRLHEVSPLLFLQNPGLRVGDAMTEIAAILYPKSFPK